MPIARFSPFELVLLQSRSQVETATLLLQAWVLVHREGISAAQRHRRLAQQAAGGGDDPVHDPAALLRIAAERDTAAIQLAAEVIRRDTSGEQRLAIMHKAIAVATDDGSLSLANHYILRFLADVLEITPATLATLFQELAGAPLNPPEDPSRDAYWRRHNPAHYQREAEREAEREAARASAERQHQEQERARREAQQREQAEQARQQEQAREREQERARQRQQRERSRRHEQQQRPRGTPPPDRTLRALAILGLSPGASREEIRKAYRRMAQLHHPDRVAALGEQRIAQASMRFQRIKKAYDYLMQTP